jgi:hypothetical protein
MTKPFNIHDWQAKQRLAEAENNRPYNWKDKPGYNPDLLGNKYDGKQKTNKYAWQDNQDSSFDDRLKAAGGFSDEEFNDITSKDIGSSFPGPSTDVGNGVIQAQELIKTLKNNYKNMSDRELDAFSVEMTKHFLDNLAARDEAKIYLAKNPSNKMGENTTGTGASFQAGAGEAYATPKAFGKNKDKNIEVLGYKKI